MPLLEKLDPEDVNPVHLVNRRELVDRVCAQLGLYLRSRDVEGGQSWLLFGDKGVGKSIVSREILSRVRKDLSGRTLIVVVDCRRVRTWRDCLRDIIGHLRTEVDEVQRLFPNEVSASLRNTVAIINEVVRWDSGELKLLEDTVQRLAGSAKVSGSHSASFLKAEFNLEVTSSRSSTQSFNGSLKLDERRIAAMLSALSRDLFEAGWRPLIYLDNIDELDHRYSTSEERQKVRSEVEGILSLKTAPVALLMNMRSYFATAFNRVATRNEVVEPLPEAELRALLQSRVQFESDSVRTWFDDATTQAGVQNLTKTAGSPFALLKWFRYLAERDQLSGALTPAAAAGYVASHYASVPLDELKTVVTTAFGHGARAVCSRADLLRACGDDETLLTQLVELQAVLPVDFWNPIRFTLDPELHTPHALWNP